MNYCVKCKVIFKSGYCPICNSRNVRTPNHKDLVFLITKDGIWSGVVEDILEQNNIPYISKCDLGVGITLKIGLSFEQFSFFVPYDRLNQARELMNEIFNDTKS